MRASGRPSALLLLLAVLVSPCVSARSNSTRAALQQAEEQFEEEGDKFAGKFVPNFASQPFKAKYLQYPYATCPDPYDSFSFVTKIRVCRDGDGFITGLKYLSEHPIRHHDPTNVCDVVGHEGATDCETLKLYTDDWQYRRYRTVTNIRTAKVKDGRSRWRVVYLAFSYSDGSGTEFGSYPHQDGAKFEQWYAEPEPGKICGLNGFFSMSSVCDARSGYLQWVKPCGKCIAKPKNYKCDADYCTKLIKRSYKGGYKGDFVPDSYEVVDSPTDNNSNSKSEDKSVGKSELEQQQPAQQAPTEQPPQQQQQQPSLEQLQQQLLQQQLLLNQQQQQLQKQLQDLQQQQQQQQAPAGRPSRREQRQQAHRQL